MKLFFKRSFGRYTVFLSFIIIFLFYTEVYRYYHNVNNWLQIECKQTDKNKCLRILLVADPQLIGYHNELLQFVTPLTTWDSDRYLSNTYNHAFKFAKPDVVIFLGDLFDEGSTGSNSEFNSYVRRLFNIFLDDRYPNVKHIWLPGDNDIGGEGIDHVTSNKLKRFYRAFAQPDMSTIKHVNFYKINRIIQNVPIMKEKKDFFDTSHLTIGLSHIPLMFTPSVFVEKVLSKMQPHLLFTAHEHKSMIISTDAIQRGDRHIVPVTPNDNKMHNYGLGAVNMIEIIVPTCSYRMGVNKIGYGLAVLDKDELYYTVLWSPTRFDVLSLYGILFFCIIFYFVFLKLTRRCMSKS